MQVVHCHRGKNLAMWSAQDALVLKWVALQVASYLPYHSRCHHVKGYGSRHSLKMVAARVHQGTDAFVYRTDIKGYYQHIRKAELIERVKSWVPDRVLAGLIEQFIHYSVEDRGEFHTPETGISRGCALSPLLGASLLFHVDAHFAARQEVFYVRYMDDFLLLAAKRWPLRRAIGQLNRFMDVSGFSLHPDKTQLGRLKHGFDWLGVGFGPDGLTIAPRALHNHRERRLRLYEQTLAEGRSEICAGLRVQMYDIRWSIWSNSLLRHDMP
jgi:hypothetical protein